MTVADSRSASRGPTLEVLDDGECLRLLSGEPVGRIGLSSGVLPVVLPVNFVVVERTVVFASDAGLKLDAARHRDVACLEVDGYDRWRHGGWSVIATGRLNEITDAGRLDEARALPVSPWALSKPHHYIELDIELLSGRRIRRS